MTPAEVLLIDDDGEAYIRGHLSAEDCADAVTAYDDQLTTEGKPFHTWGRRGFMLDEDGDFRNGAIYSSLKYEGQRGAFRLTVISAVER